MNHGTRFQHVNIVKRNRLLTNACVYMLIFRICMNGHQLTVTTRLHDVVVSPVNELADCLEDGHLDPPGVEGDSRAQL